MATHPDYPGASSRISNGKVYWRYRTPRSRDQVTLPGQPGDEDFETAYAHASRVKTTAEILNMPGRSEPRSWGAAARLLDQQDFWVAHSPETKRQEHYRFEAFLNGQIEPDAPMTFRDAPFELTKRRHLAAHLMPVYEATPHAARQRLNVIKKLVRIAITEKWLEPEDDPTLSIKLKKKKYIGEKAWSDAAMAKYEAFYPHGTAARTCYEIARWLGNRCGDVALLKWDVLQELEEENANGEFVIFDAFVFNQHKNRHRGSKLVVLPVTNKLRAALAPLKPEPGKTVLQRFDGEPYSVKALTGQMAYWTKRAGLEPGHTLHGLRKNFARTLLKSGTDIMVIRDMLGHSEIATTQIYIEGLRLEDNALEARDRINDRERKRDAARRQANIRLVGKTG